MNRTSVSSDEIPPPAGPYSPAIVCGGFAFLSGQGPYRADGSLAGTCIESQTRQTLENLATVAEAAGGKIQDAVRIGVFLTDMENFQVMNSVLAELFTEPYPARTTVQTGLPQPEMLIEIEAVIALSPGLDAPSA